MLQAWVELDGPGLTGVSVSALATPGLVEAVAFQVCPDAPGNLFAGACGDQIGNTLGPIGVSNVVLGEQNAGSPGGVFDPTPIPGLSGSFVAVQLSTQPGIPAGSSLVLSEITFDVTGTGSGEVLPYYRAGVDGALDVGSDVYLPRPRGPTSPPA